MSTRNHLPLFLAVIIAVVAGAAASGHAAILYAGSTNGEVFTISQTNASGTVLGTATGDRISGFAIRSDRRVFASTVAGSSNPSTLIEIDPANGRQISTIGTITDITISGPGGNGTTLKIADLSFQPGTNVLFGVTAGNASNNVGGTLYTINTETAEATLVGQTCATPDYGAAIAFGPDGTLYLVGEMQTNGAQPAGGTIDILATIDPADGSCITTVPIGNFYDGLAVRGDGVIFASQGDDSGIVKLDPMTGAATFIGNSVEDAGDMDFLVVEQQLINISTRAQVGTGQSVAIGGFIINTPQSAPTASGNGAEASKRLLIRGIGPSLRVQGVPLTNRLLDPVLELYDGNGELLTLNDNWRDTQEGEITGTGLAPTDNAEAAIVVMVAADANYTVVLRGKNNGTGTGLVEMYDLDSVVNASSSLVNISTRAFVSTGDQVLIGGTIVGGADPVNIVLRGLGPSMAAAGIAGALLDPTLELYDANANLLEMNDDWGDSPDAAAITASGLAPTNPKEAALYVTPDMPGAYTVVLRGKNGTTGIGLVEAYRLPSATPAPVN